MKQAQAAIADAKRTHADAEAFRILTEARAEAEANQLLAKSLTRALLRYKQVERWDGQYPTTLMGDAGGVLIELPLDGKR